MKYFLLALLLTACGPKHETAEPTPDARVGELRAKDSDRKAEALTLRDPATGWLATGGDGMLWTGKYAAVTGVDGVKIYAAEKEPGRFSRDPDGETSEDPAWSDWSRDMGTGLLAYVWRKGNLTMLQRHIAYGEAHKAISHNLPVWKMGEPVGDGRGLYLPAFIGRLYQTQHALGGPEDDQRLWPDLYTKGLVDYQAHLQVMNVWHRGEVEEALRKRNADAVPPPDEPVTDDAAGQDIPLVLDVTEDQLAVLREHAARDPRDPLFQAVLGVYTGDMGPALDACLSPDDYAGEYVRCDGNPRTCQLAALLLACDIVLRRFGD